MINGQNYTSIKNLSKSISTNQNNNNDDDGKSQGRQPKYKNQYQLSFYVWINILVKWVITVIATVSVLALAANYTGIYGSLTIPQELESNDKQWLVNTLDIWLYMAASVVAVMVCLIPLLVCFILLQSQRSQVEK